MFQERIRRIYPILPPSHQVIADFLLNSYQEAAFMSGSQLAQHLQVDPATVVRFSQRLGYSGYPQLRQEMQELVRQEIRARYQPLTEEETPGELYRRTVHNARELLSQMVVLDAGQAITEIVRHLAEARRIYLLSEGTEAHAVALFAALLRRQGLDAQAVPPGQRAIAEAMCDVGEGDVVIGMLLDDDGYDLAAAVQLARDRGAFTAAFVGVPSSTLARSAEVAITCPQAELPHLTCGLVLLVSIAHILSMLHPRPEAEERAEQVRAVMDQLEALRQQAARR